MYLSGMTPFRRFQPTHPHGVRLEQRDPGYRARLVSTHAPARGATRIFQIVSLCLSEFQPTHPHGVRRMIFTSK